MMHRNESVNLQVTGVAVIVLVASLVIREPIPVKSGAGHDGSEHKRWAQGSSVEKIWLPMLQSLEVAWIGEITWSNHA
ncbi:MAG: hypothetical protein GY944_13955 [bacterium]|nr:hypothetical protein [bacterium]